MHSVINLMLRKSKPLVVINHRFMLICYWHNISYDKKHILIKKENET